MRFTIMRFNIMRSGLMRSMVLGALVLAGYGCQTSGDDDPTMRYPIGPAASAKSTAPTTPAGDMSDPYGEEELGEGDQIYGLSASAGSPPSGAVFPPIYFGYDQSTLTEAAQTGLQIIAKKMAADPSLSIQVEGHCDERGTTEYNLALGDRRASIVISYLTNLGVNPNRLASISYGEERPAETGSNESSWAKNRRAEFAKQSLSH